MTSGEFRVLSIDMGGIIVTFHLLTPVPMFPVSMDRKEGTILRDGYTMVLTGIHCVTIAELSINLFMVTRLHGYTMDFL